MLPASGDEFEAEEQIARQVADQRQLRRDGEIGAGTSRLTDGIGNQPGIAGQVADRRVDL